MYKGQEHYTINSSDTIEMFYNIRVDLDKLKYATHITRIIQDVTTENENTYKILQLYLNTLYMISETDKNMDFILSIFKIKLLCFLGFKPQIEKCLNCGSTENLSYFSVKNNGCLCNECNTIDKEKIKISSSTVTALKYIVLAPAKKLFSFELKNDSLEELKIISKVYLNDKLEKEYRLENLF